jgi:hypothetical protein
VSAASASLEEARKNLNKTIYSPVGGTVQAQREEAGGGHHQMAGTEIMRIANLNL